MTTEQINEITDDLELEMRCFVHKKTNAIISFFDHPDSDQPEWIEARKQVKRFPTSYREITKMSGDEGFKMMEEFTSTIADERIRTRAERALSNPKPFRHFKAMIDDAGDYRELWFAFRRHQWVEHVSKQLKVAEKIPKRSIGPMENFF